MNKITITLTILLTSLLLACNNTEKTVDESTGEKITLHHKFGEIEVNQNPKRVVVFDLGILETLNELDVEVVGVAKNFLPEHLSKYKSDEIGDVGSVKEANFESVNALAPDIILIAPRLESSYDELSKIAPTICLEINAQDYMDSFKENTMTLAKLFNKEEEAAKKLGDIDENVKTAQEKIGNNDKKGLILLYNNGRYSAYGPHSRFGFIHDVLNIKPAEENIAVSTHGQVVSNEFILNTNPDYLFIVDRNKVVNQRETIKDEIENPLIKQTNASKNDKIIYLDPAVWYLSQGGLISTQKMIDEIVNNI